MKIAQILVAGLLGFSRVGAFFSSRGSLIFANRVDLTLLYPPPPTYLVFWEQLVLCTVLRRRKNHFKNQNSCFFFQNQEALVCKPLFPHVSNAFSQQPLSYWQKCYSLNLSETRTLIRCQGRTVSKPHIRFIFAQSQPHCMFNSTRSPYECSGFR